MYFKAFIILIFLSSSIKVNAGEFTSYTLKHLDAQDAVTMLKPLTDSKLSIQPKNNTIIIRGSKSKTKNIVALLKKIDKPPKQLTLEFISSKRKLVFNKNKNIYETNRNDKTAQSITIQERQWVTVNTGISIPIRERTRSNDGSESQTTRYKDISQKYLFNIYEIDNKAYIKVVMDSSTLNNHIAKSIAYKKLETSINGKVGEWLEVSSNKIINKDKNNDITFSTKRHKSNTIHLYLRITK